MNNQYTQLRMLCRAIMSAELKQLPATNHHALKQQQHFQT
jgi:hypothetical protein